MSLCLSRLVCLPELLSGWGKMMGKRFLQNYKLLYKYEALTMRNSITLQWLNLICSLRRVNFFEIKKKKKVIALVASLSNLVSNLVHIIENEGTCKTVLWHEITEKRRISGISVVFDRQLTKGMEFFLIIRGR